jgi:hypothetical protein
MSKLEASFFTTETPLEFYGERDQLRLESALNGFLSVYREGPLNFGPTYKFHKDRNEYEADRIPGWTDRVFYYSRRG